MKSFLMTILFLSLFQQSYAYDERLYINVQKASALLARAENRGTAADGSVCYVELRRIEDGYYTIYTASEDDQLFIGLDIEAYGKITSSWTKRSFTLKQRGKEGTQELKMKEEFSTKKLSVFSKESIMGKTVSTLCYLPLK